MKGLKHLRTFFFLFILSTLNVHAKDCVLLEAAYLLEKNRNIMDCKTFKDSQGKQLGVLLDVAINPKNQNISKARVRLLEKNEKEKKWNVKVF